MDKILKYSTFGYAILILLGYSSVEIYYRNWGIDIYSYLDASEILLIFLKIINRLLQFLVSVLFLIGAFAYFEKGKLNTQAAKKEPVIINNKLEIVLTIIIVVGTFVFFWFIANWFQKIVDTDTEIPIYPYTFLIIAIVAVLFYYEIPRIIEKWQIKLNILITRLILILMCVYLLNLFNAVDEFRDVRDKKNVSDVSFVYNITQYKTCDSIIYIGATSKYFFLRNTNNKSNYIFEKENVTNLRITKIK